MFNPFKFLGWVALTIFFVWIGVLAGLNGKGFDGTTFDLVTMILCFVGGFITASESSECYRSMTKTELANLRNIIKVVLWLCLGLLGSTVILDYTLIFVSRIASVAMIYLIFGISSATYCTVKAIQTFREVVATKEKLNEPQLTPAA